MYDGYLGQSDYGTYADRLANAFGWADSSHVHKKLHHHFLNEWQQIQQFADSDGDNQVTLKEWLTFYDTMLASPEMTKMAIKAYMAGYYELWDIVDPESRHLGQIMTIDGGRMTKLSLP